jgi:hypothetical protein
MPSGLISPVARQRQFTDLGVTSPGAKAYFYAAGTDTPATTYSEPTLVTANANPVIASSGGAFGPIYLAYGVAYDVEIQNSVGTIIVPRTQIGVGGNATTVVRTDVCDGRLTLTSGTPVTVTDVTAATTLYYTPNGGDQVALSTGSAVEVLTFTELSYSLAALAANTNYDIWLNYNSGTPVMESTAWTDASTRATAVTRLRGFWVKSGATTRRLLGSIRTVAAGQTEDSAVKRFVFNADLTQRVPRRFYRKETAGSWTYTLAVIRQANANTANQVATIIGLPDSFVSVLLTGIAANSTGGVGAQVTIGEDATATWATESIFDAVQLGAGAGVTLPLHASLQKVPAIGYHYYTWEEYSGATGTTTWGGAGGGLDFWTGLSGYVLA